MKRPSRTNKHITIYPDSFATEVLGSSRSPDTTLAVECWAVHIQDSHNTLPEFTRQAWGFFAEALRNKNIESHWSTGSLVQACHEAANLDRLQEKWFGKGKNGLKLWAEFSATIETLTFSQTWAIFVTAGWFWRHASIIEVDHDEWWTIPYRRRITRHHEAKKKKQAHQIEDAKSAKKKKKTPKSR